MRLASLLAAAGLATAITPPGFQPASQNQLFVQYGNQAALNGQVVAQQITQVQPSISTNQRLNGTFAVIMVDLDIPTDSPPQTGTLLHWMQTGLTASAQATTLQASTGGNQQVFLLQNTQNTPALAEYIGPNPPARVPLSHRYTFVLVDHSRISQQGLQALQTASGTRFGFNAMSVLQQAGLSNAVVAGNFFNVTNSGTATTPGGTVGNGTTGGVTPGGTGVSNIPGSTGTLGVVPTGFVPGTVNGGAMLSPKASSVVSGILIVAGLFLTF